jgi:hypothetical protein
VAGEPFRAYAVPEAMFVTTRFGTHYGILRETVVEGPIALDASNGRLTFIGLGPRGGVRNINGRLGGREGPLSVDGSIAWICGVPPAEVPPEPPPPG